MRIEKFILTFFFKVTTSYTIIILPIAEKKKKKKMVSFTKFTLLLAAATSVAASGYKKFAVSFISSNDLLNTAPDQDATAKQWEAAFDKARASSQWKYTGFDVWTPGLSGDWEWVTTTRNEADYARAKNVLERMGFEAEFRPTGHVWFRPKLGASPPGPARQ